MKKKIRTLLLVICALSLVRLSFIIIFDSNVYKEENRVITAKVYNIEKDKDKIVIDIRKKEGYRLTLYEKINVEEGDVIKVTGKVITPSDNTVFGLFNYRKYLLSKKINYIVKPNSVKVISKNKNILYKLKNNMDKKIENYKSRAYLKAFLMGDTTLIDKNIKSNYQLIGISHLLSISGMHVNLLLLIISFMFKKFKYKNLIIFMFLLFFMFITGFPISLIRVCLFLGLNYLNKLLKLNIKPTFIIILTALLLILYNPYLVYNVGFLFSVIITFFLILISEKLRKQKGYFKSSLRISMVSFLASIPLLAYCFFKINFLTPIYNLVFVPFVSFILFPLCIFTFLFQHLIKSYFSL